MDLYDQLVRKLYLEAKAKQAAELEQKRQAELEAAIPGPAERLYEAVSPVNVEQIRQARDREPQKEPEKEIPREAERMAPRPAGMHLQGPPSPGGGVNYVNTRVWKSVNTEPAQAKHQDLHDQVMQERKEARASMSKEDLERQELEKIERQLREHQVRSLR